jgi:outer membrane protein OmpA-like peptidoglycan-associated protein
MKYSHIIAISTLGVLAACASGPKRVAQLDEARTKVQALSQEALVQEAASKELTAAHENLKLADEALQKGEPEERVAHLAYLAQRNAEIGLARVDEAEAKDQVAKAEFERNRVLLDARTQEAEMAKQRAAEAELAAAAKAEEAESAQAALAELQAEQTERGMVLTLSDVLFDTAAATLKPGAASAIDRLGKYLEGNPDSRVIIEGHTDSRGSEAYNEDLSRRRAQAVADELVTRGISSDRLEVLGRGEGYPVANNGTAEGRQQNRRVEIIFSDEAGKFAPGVTTGSLRDE